jgi:hypothetical protein
MGAYAGVDNNLTLYPLQSRLQHIYHGQPYARVDFIPLPGTLDLDSDQTLWAPLVCFLRRSSLENS